MIKTARRFYEWLTGSKSDFILFIILLILINLAGSNTFLRFDLTSQHSYSLSRGSRDIVKTIEEPLSVKVFFSAKLPAPYNSTERYLRDLLLEYAGAGNKNFSYEFFDMEKPENQDEARSYGLNQIQIQQVKDDEVGIKNAYMGLALVYGDAIEILDGLASADGLEYRLTMTIGKMVSTVNALSGLPEKVRMTLFASSALQRFNIQGFNELDTTVSGAYSRVNRKSMDKIEFARADPQFADINSLADRYGLQKINWNSGPKNGEQGLGTLGIVLEYQDRFKTIPLELTRNLFGFYAIVGLDKLEQSLSDGLQSLMSKSLKIGYVTGHGERDLNDAQNGAARLSSLISDMYEFTPIETAASDIPSNVSMLVVNGPRNAFTESELYKIDQFLMRGGNLFLLLDPYDEIRLQGDAYYGTQPIYKPITTGLERLLAKYGVKTNANYVLDKACYVVKNQGTGEMPIYYAPILAKESLNAKHVVSRNLAYVVFLQSGALEITGDKNIVPLATSSSDAWLLSGSINLSPYVMQVPPKEELAKRNLAVLLEGPFESAFAGPPPEVSAKNAGADLNAESYLAKSAQAGKIIVIGTSAITLPSVLDEAGQQPIAVFLRNSVDYLCGNAELIEMRTKGLGLNTLDKTTAIVRTTARAMNLYGLPALVALAGLIAWRLRVTRRRKIEAQYAPGGKKGTEA